MTIKKILVLSHEFPPLGGGGGRVLARLCEELATRGFQITVLTAAPPLALRQKYSFAVVYFPTIRKAQFKTSVPAMVLYLAQVLLYCVTGKARGHEFLFSNMSIPAGIAGIVARRILRLPHGIWYHNTEITQNRPNGAGWLFRAAYRFIGKRASINLFVSKGLMDLAKRYGTVPGMGVLPNAVAPLTDATGSRINEMAGPEESHHEENKFLFAARMEAVKGPLLFLEAIDLLKARGQVAGLRFLLIGSGALYRRVAGEIVKRGLGPMVTLQPAVPFLRMADLYRSACALVLPSVVEGYPTTVLEAGMVGVPTIATRTIGNSDAVVDGETGLLFPPGDATALADAILKLANEPDLRGRLGKNAYVRSKTFAIGTTADIFTEALKKL